MTVSPPLSPAGRRQIIIDDHLGAKHNTIDPSLTKKGVEQSLELSNHLAEHLPLDDRRIELIITSPMARTLLTSLYAFPDLFRRDGVPVVADARWQGEFSLALFCPFLVFPKTRGWLGG